VKHADFYSKGTPRNIRIANSTVNGGTLALDAGIRDAIIQGNEFTNNGVILDGKRVKLFGNTVSGGSGLVLTGESLRLENNTFENNQNGTVAADCSPIFVNNDFVRNQYGVYADTRGQPKLKYNNFEDNVQYGVYNKDSSTPVNATLNWWNAADGPGGEGSGGGDSVSKFVLYEPWLDEESDHLGHYENLAPEIPTLYMPAAAPLAFDARGRANDPEGDIIRRVELRIENVSHGSGDYDSGWFSSLAIWRDVDAWGCYAHIFDALELDGDYTASARAFDGNDYSETLSAGIIIAQPELEPRAPIVITGDDDFTEANGVRSGSGSEGDPFVIERWEITTEDADGISISDTTAHVVIRLCHIYWPEARDPDNNGIALSNAVNVRVEDCRFQGNYYQMNLIQGSQAGVKGCLFLDAGSGEIRSQQSDLELTGSWFRGEKVALSMTGGNDENGLVEGNIIVFKGTGNGGIFLYTIDSHVSGNIFMNGTVTAGTTNEDIDFQIHDNTFSGGSAGIWFNDGSPEITRNLIVDHTGWGVYGSRSTMTLRNNNLFGNKNWGVQNKDDSAIIDAKYNWWGASNGPSGEGGGDGDAVSEYVEFDPWLTEPVNINHAPSIEIMEPDGENDETDETGFYTITWDAADEDGDALTIDLYCDDDTNPENGRTLIASGLKNSGSHEWDTSDVPDGDYHVCGAADDHREGSSLDYSSGMVSIRHGPPPNHAPEIEIIEPDGEDDGCDAAYTIEWRASDDDHGDTLTIDLYFDTDTDPGNGKTAIATGLENTGSYDWVTSAISEGDYYIYGIADDNNGSRTADYSDGMVSVLHPPNNPPEVEITSPDDGSAVSGLITLRGAAHDDDGSIEKVEVRIGNGGWQLADGTTSWELEVDTTGYADGWYDIVARVYDGEDYSDEEAEDAAISLEFHNPPPNVAPWIEMDYPRNGSIVKGIVAISGEAEDDNGDDSLDTVEIRMDEGGWKIATATGRDGKEWTDWEFVLDTRELEDGWHTISARAFDGELYSEIVWIEILVKNIVPPEPNQPPAISFFNTDRQKYKTSGSATFSAEIMDENGADDITAIELTLYILENGVETKVVSFLENQLPVETTGEDTVEISLEVPLKDFVMGSYSAVLEVEDSRGETAAETIHFTLEKKGSGDDEGLFGSAATLFPLIGAGAALLVVGAFVFVKKRESGGTGDYGGYEESDEGDGEHYGEEGVSCPACGGGTQYSEGEDDFYCWECEEYVGEMKDMEA